MKKSRIVFIVALLALSACGHDATPTASAVFDSGNRGALSIVHTSGSRFWEYTLPSGVTPTTLANGPNNTVWFTGCNNTPNVYRLSAATGLVTFLKAPTPYGSGCQISSAGGYFWYSIDNTAEAVTDLVRVSTTGLFTVFDTDITGGVTDMTGGSEGQLWLALRNRIGNCYTLSGIPGDVQSVSSLNGSGFVMRLPSTWVCARSIGCFCVGYYQPIALAEASDKNVYVTAFYAGGPTLNPSGLGVIKIPTSTRVPSTFVLPKSATTVWSGWFGAGAGPLPITGGPDGRLWIGEFGLNTIAGMTTGGSFTSFKVPTASAGISSITAVPGTIDASAALWFTESSSNKIARISTSGAFTEVPVPTAGAQPNAIIPCPTTACGLHGGVWFVETAAHKIARYDFP